MPNYGHIPKPSNPDAARGGYKNVLLVIPRADFLTFAKPPAAPAALGDGYKINTAHTFAANKGYYEWASKLKSVVGKGTTGGDEGAYQMKYSFEGVVIGDSASTQEQMHRALNDDLVWFVKDSNCLVTDSYIQYGDECDSPVIKAEFDSQNSDGTKNWKISGEVSGKRFFYNAALVKAA